MPTTAPVAPTASRTPSDPAVTATAAVVAEAVANGNLAVACARSLCTPQLAAAVAQDPGPGAASAPSVSSSVAHAVDIETVSDDGQIATVDVWLEGQGADGQLRSYRITLACQSDASWRVAGVAP